MAPEAAGPDKAKVPEQTTSVQPDKVVEVPKAEKTVSASIFNLSEIMAAKKMAEKAGTQQELPKEQIPPPKCRSRPAKDEKAVAPAQKVAPGKKDKAEQKPAPTKKPKKSSWEGRKSP